MSCVEEKPVAAPVTFTKQDKVGFIRIDNPPVNALSQAVRQGIMDCLQAALADEDVAIILLSCAGRTFIAGADISEFGKPPLEPHLPDVLQRLDASPKPVVAAIHGTALGGGFETALACRYRVALKGAKVGLPEVTLGLIPGAGGTQRLPRIAGVETALDMITTGKPRSVESLVDAGVIDEVVAGDLDQAASSYARNLITTHGQLSSPVSLRKIEKPADYETLFSSWRNKTSKKYRGQISPGKAIDAIENALLLPFAEGMAKEREIFLALRDSAQAKALRHAFFAEREAAKVPGISKEIETKAINTVAIIGAGTMGGGIAICFANAGIPVTLLEMNSDNLNRGLAAIRSRFEQDVNKGRISAAQLQERMAKIQGSCDDADLGDADLVIEAAFENLEVKREIFSKLDKHCKPDAILATNTSYLNINKIAAATNRPQQVLGMHFFSPANIMKLLEVVRAEKTSDATLASALKLGKSIGKIAVAVGVCYGFVGNRMYACYGREGQMLLLEGATPQQIDNAMESWGMAMGPLSVMDLSGLDIGYKARRENPDRPDDPNFFRPADLLVEMERLGRKSGAGFYRYDPESGAKNVDDEVIEIIRDEAKQLGVEQRKVSDEEIQQRLIYALINEGAKILEAGIALRASDIDVIWLNGYGFPRYRGGPMHYALEIGLGKVLDGIKNFQKQNGKRYWQAAALLESSAARNQWPS